MMSICLTWFLISGLGKPKLYQNMWCFTRIRVGCGGSGGGTLLVPHDVKKNKVIRNKVNLTNFIRSIIKK